MRVKHITTILLILCGLGIGWLAFENLMWAVWGKQNRWFEYVGFWGCGIMVAAGLVALKDLRLGTYVGAVGFVLMLFYLSPAVVRLIHEIMNGRVVLKATQIVELVLIIGIPLMTLATLMWNLKTAFSPPVARQRL
jgi:hypothetical protein